MRVGYACLRRQTPLLDDDATSLYTSQDPGDATACIKALLEAFRSRQKRVGQTRFFDAMATANKQPQAVIRVLESLGQTLGAPPVGEHHYARPLTHTHTCITSTHITQTPVGVFLAVPRQRCTAC